MENSLHLPGLVGGVEIHERKVSPPLNSPTLSRYSTNIVLEDLVLDELSGVVDFAFPLSKTSSEDIDFAITIGGDGTLLFLNSIFQGSEF